MKPATIAHHDRSVILAIGTVFIAVLIAVVLGEMSFDYRQSKAGSARLASP